MVGECFLERPTVCLIHKPCATILLLSPGSSVGATPRPEGPTLGWAPEVSAAPQAGPFWDATLPSLRAQSLERGGSPPCPPGARSRVLRRMEVYGLRLTYANGTHAQNHRSLPRLQEQFGNWHKTRRSLRRQSEMLPACPSAAGDSRCQEAVATPPPGPRLGTCRLGGCPVECGLEER